MNCIFFFLRNPTSLLEFTITIYFQTVYYFLLIIKKCCSNKHFNLIVGIGTTMSLLGTAASYVLGPTIVTEIPDTETSRNEIFFHRRNMRNQISLLCLVGNVILFI